MGKIGPTTLVLGLAAISLGGCMSGTGGTGASSSPILVTMASTESDLLTTPISDTHGSNGLRFAQDGDDKSDFSGVNTKIRVAYLRRDWDTNEVTIDILEESATLASNSFNSGTLDHAIAFTLNGEIIALEDSSVVIGDNHWNWGDAWQNSYSGSNGYAASISRYLLSTSKPQELMFFISGTETNPNTIAALTSSATYSGRYYTQGVSTHPGGVNSEWTSLIMGDLNLYVDFDDSTVSGDMASTYLMQNSDSSQGTIDGIIEEATIEGNSFTANIVYGTTVQERGDMGLTHTSSNSQMGGTFYASDGGEISGIMTMNEFFADGDGQEFEYVGVGYFVTDQ